MTTTASTRVVLDPVIAAPELRSSLRTNSVRGALAAVVSQSLRTLLQMGSTIVLARLLTPADYGLMGMVAAVVGFVVLFKDLGLSAATVQRKEITHGQISTLFWINVGLSVCLAALVAISAPWIAWFYREPRLTGITLAVSATFVLGGLTAQHHALLQRHMRFKTLAVVDLSAMGGGVAVAILMASMGYGYWALVGHGAATQVVNMILVWVVSPWRPGWPSRRSGVREMLAFGGGLTGFNAVNYLVRNLDNVMIGWCWGAASLGLYAKAYDLLLMPLRRINNPISSVAIPVLSRLQGDDERFRRYYLGALSLLTMICMPIVVVTCIFADVLIPVLLGERWSSAVPIYRVMALAAFVDTFNVASGWVCQPLGQSGRQFRWQVVESAATVIAFAIGLYWGPLGVAVGFSISRCCLRWPCLWYCFAESPMTVSRVVEAIWRPATASLAAGAAVLLLPEFSGPLVRLCIGALVYAIVYVGLLLLLPGSWKHLRTVHVIAQELRSKRRGGQT